MCRFIRYRSTLGALASGLLVLTLSNNAAADEPSPKAQRLASLARSVERDYPGVRHISVAELKTEFAGSLLVDVRETNEYQKSHLPGAVHAPTSAAVDALHQQHPDRSLVFYCTVGVRSAIAAEAFVERYPAADRPPAVNLSGSIFAWANAGEPLVDAQGPTTEVHPYSFWWGWRYLDADRPQLSQLENEQSKGRPDPK